MKSETVFLDNIDERYALFLSQVISQGGIWVLAEDDELALTEETEQTLLLPVWPDRDSAEKNISGFWSGYAAKKIELGEWLLLWTPDLKWEKIDITVDWDQGTGIRKSAADFEKDLRKAMSNGKGTNKDNKAWGKMEKPKEILSEEDVIDLFQFLEKQLDENECDGTLRFTNEWLEARFSGDVLRKIYEKIENDGGFCDCEVLYNCFQEYDI